MLYSSKTMVVFVILLFILSGCTNKSLPNQKNQMLCGNGIIDLNEECDSKNTCPDSLICGSDCRCYSQSDSNTKISCAQNSQNLISTSQNKFNQNFICSDDCSATDSASSCDPITCTCTRSCGNSSILKNNSFDSNSIICKDDCKEFGTNLVCDGNCSCKPTIPSRGCSINTAITAFSGTNSFIPGAMLCMDDCWTVAIGATCNANCICQKPNPPQTSCVDNSKKVNNGIPNVFNPINMVCKDDCKATDPLSVCDPKTCVCKKNLPPSCTDNSFKVFFGGKNEFNPFGGLACKDDCKNLDPSLSCDPLTCVCKEGQKNKTETVNCAANTIFSSNIFGFDSSLNKCQDNCKELGSDYVCESSSCTCKKKIIENISTTSCAQNTQPTTGSTLTKAPPGTMCRDDCQSSFGSEYICESLSCQCIKKERLPEFSCLSNSLNSIWEGKSADKLPQNYLCKDDCSDPDFYCEPTNCVCKPKINETIETGRSCALNTYDSIYNNNNSYQGNLCKDDCNFIGSDYKCDSSTCICKPIELNDTINETKNQTWTAGKCGDGLIINPEQCDLGSPNTNKCSEGNYCTKDCLCKKLETSVVCGDGKISSPNEDCDGGSVSTNLCGSGYSCKLCKCVPTQAICGDGSITPPEECDSGNTNTAKCANGYSCQNCKCSGTTTYTQKHSICDYVHQACILVDGSGKNECSYDYDCIPKTQPICGNGVKEFGEQCDGNEFATCGDGYSCTSSCTCMKNTTTMHYYHYTCDYVHGACMKVDGSGTNECSSDSDCSRTTTVAYHYECDFTHGACMKVDGTGTSNCANDVDCQKPTLDCPAYCSSIGYSQNLGGGYDSASSCSAAVSESPQQCTVKCVYSKFYSQSNQAGTSTCCCKSTYVQSCTQTTNGCTCPTQSEVQNVICPSHKP